MPKEMVRAKRLHQLFTQAIKLVRATQSTILEIAYDVGNVLQDAEGVTAGQRVARDAMPITQKFPPSLAKVLQRIRNWPFR